MEKRENATKWESKTSECYEFQCSNESGPIYWKQCNKTNEVCENDECVEVKEEVVYTVEIEVEDIDVTYFNLTELQSTISDLTNISSDKLRIRLDTNDDDTIIRIIILVDDKTTAETIKATINVAIKEHNQKGVFKHF